MKKIIKKITMLVFISAFSACGGGGGGGGGTTGPSLTADFTAGTAGSTPNVILQKNSASGSTVNVNVIVTGVSNLYGSDIKITYDSTKVKWGGSYQAGSVLEASGTVNYLVGLDGGVEGTLVVGASLQGAAPPVNPATGVLVTIPFTVTSTGTSAITFTLTNLYDNVPASVTVSSNAGGTISGV